jgi:hypothetical protein
MTLPITQTYQLRSLLTFNTVAQFRGAKGANFWERQNILTFFINVLMIF